MSWTHGQTFLLHENNTWNGRSCELLGCGNGQFDSYWLLLQAPHAPIGSGSKCLLALRHAAQPRCVSVLCCAQNVPVMFVRSSHHFFAQFLLACRPPRCLNAESPKFDQISSLRSHAFSAGGSIGLPGVLRCGMRNATACIRT
jgi:hypothetical protein